MIKSCSFMVEVPAPVYQALRKKAEREGMTAQDAAGIYIQAAVEAERLKKIDPPLKGLATGKFKALRVVKCESSD